MQTALITLHKFAEQWYRLRALSVFRDDSTLSATSSLWEPIAFALDRSNYLILLASTSPSRGPP
jgi:hypothetical protein